MFQGLARSNSGWFGVPHPGKPPLIYIYIHTHTYMYIYIWNYVYIYISHRHVCVYINIYIQNHTYMYVFFSYNISIHMISNIIWYYTHFIHIQLFSSIFAFQTLSTSSFRPGPKQQHSHVTSRSRKRRLLAARLPSNPWHWSFAPLPHPVTKDGHEYLDRTGGFLKSLVTTSFNTLQWSDDLDDLGLPS